MHVKVYICKEKYGRVTWASLFLKFSVHEKKLVEYLLFASLCTGDYMYNTQIHDIYSHIHTNKILDQHKQKRLPLIMRNYSILFKLINARGSWVKTWTWTCMSKMVACYNCDNFIIQKM